MNKQFLDTIRATNECSLEEYIYVYPRFMKEHINREGGRDNTELSFIKEQIKEHETYIEIEKHTQKRFLDIGYANNKHLNYEDYNLAGMSFTNSVISQKAIINYLKTKKSELKSPQQIETIKNQNPKKTLLEFIHNVGDNEGFILGLKNMFPTEKGKSIKAIVIKLVDAEILIHGTKEFRQFYDELKIYFKRDIGTYQSINDPKTIDKEITNAILKKLNPLIIKHKLI